MLRREAADYLGGRVPALFVDETVEIELSGRQLDIYNQILEQELTPGKKIIQLEKAMLDPRIVDPTLLRDTSVLTGLEPQKYAALDEIINRARIHLLEKEKRRKIRGQKRREEPGMTQGALGFTINF